MPFCRLKRPGKASRGPGDAWSPAGLLADPPAGPRGDDCITADISLRGQINRGHAIIIPPKVILLFPLIPLVGSVAGFSVLVAPPMPPARAKGFDLAFRFPLARAEGFDLACSTPPPGLRSSILYGTPYDLLKMRSKPELSQGRTLKVQPRWGASRGQNLSSRLRLPSICTLAVGVKIEGHRVKRKLKF